MKLKVNEYQCDRYWYYRACHYDEHMNKLPLWCECPTTPWESDTLRIIEDKLVDDFYSWEEELCSYEKWSLTENVILDAIYNDKVVAYNVDTKQEYLKSDILMPWTSYFIENKYVEAIMNIFAYEANYGFTDDIVLLLGLIKMIETLNGFPVTIYPQLFAIIIILTHNENHRVAEKAAQYFVDIVLDGDTHTHPLFIQQVKDMLIHSTYPDDSPVHKMIDAMNSY